MSAEEPFQPVKSADRALQVLEALAQSPGQRSLGEMSRDLRIPKSSLHGILRTMARRGWVEADDTGTRFSLGLRALRVGTTYIERDDMVVRIQPVLDWLSAELGETTHLGRLDGSDVVYLAKRESRHPLRLYSAIGRRLPAHATALGKALLATYPDRAVEEILPSSLVALTSHTITDRDALLTELKRCREVGYAIDHEENSEGIRCYAVPLPTGTSGPATDAVSISIPMFRLTDELEERAVGLLQQVGDRLERVG